MKVQGKRIAYVISGALILAVTSAYAGTSGTGTPMTTGSITQTTRYYTTTAASGQTIIQYCNQGEIVDGGGYNLPNGGPSARITQSQPYTNSSGLHGWEVTIYDDYGYNNYITVHALCMKSSS